MDNEDETDASRMTGTGLSIQLKADEERDCED